MCKPRNLLSIVFVLAVAIFLAVLPAHAKTKTSTATTAPAAETDSSTASTPAPAASTTPAAPPVNKNKTIEVEDISTSTGKNSIDVYLTLTNNGKLPDALAGAETTLSDNMTLVTVADKKETTGPIRVDLPVGKAVKLAEGEKFLRISDIKEMPKDGKFQIQLHFRAAPNLMIDVNTHK